MPIPFSRATVDVIELLSISSKRHSDSHTHTRPKTMIIIAQDKTKTNRAPERRKRFRLDKNHGRHIQKCQLKIQTSRREYGNFERVPFFVSFVRFVSIFFSLQRIKQTINDEDKIRSSVLLLLLCIFEQTVTIF